jgi:hypothetical protein
VVGVGVVLVVIGCARWDGTGDLPLDEGLSFLHIKLRGGAEGRVGLLNSPLAETRFW